MNNTQKDSFADKVEYYGKIIIMFIVLIMIVKLIWGIFV